MIRILLHLPVLAALGLTTTSSDVSAEDAPSISASEVVELSERDLKYFARQFKAKCALCHGKEGDGSGANAGAQLRPPANFTDASFMATRSDQQLYEQIRKGGEDASAMPAFGPTSAHAWSEEKIRKMVAFLRTFAKEAEGAADPSAGESPSAPAGDEGPRPITPETVRPGLPFYSDDFALKGHVRGLLQEKNLEEVYQNYRYYEARYDEAQRVVEFKEFLRGDVVLTESYVYALDGRLKERRVTKPGESAVTTTY